MTTTTRTIDHLEREHAEAQQQFDQAQRDLEAAEEPWRDPTPTDSEAARLEECLERFRSAMHRAFALMLVLRRVKQ